jgi:hypothetical protein
MNYESKGMSLVTAALWFASFLIAWVLLCS